MSTVVEHTLSEMILLAAHQLEEQGQSPFSAEDLIVASWRQFPRAFGLRGYSEQYPDSNRVLSSIMGEKGLARKGWLAKVGQKLYSLAKDGRRVVERLDEEPEEEPEFQERSKVGHLPREQEKLLMSLLESSAITKVADKRRYELSFADACRFWGITENLSGEALDARLDRVESILEQAGRLVQRDGLAIGNREIEAADMELLRDTNNYLLERFSRHLGLIRDRTARQ